MNEIITTLEKAWVRKPDRLLLMLRISTLEPSRIYNTAFCRISKTYKQNNSVSIQGKRHVPRRGSVKKRQSPRIPILHNTIICRVWQWVPRERAKVIDRMKSKRISVVELRGIHLFQPLHSQCRTSLISPNHLNAVGANPRWLMPLPITQTLNLEMRVVHTTNVWPKGAPASSFVSTMIAGFWRITLHAIAEDHLGLALEGLLRPSLESLCFNAQRVLVISKSNHVMRMVMRERSKRQIFCNGSVMGNYRNFPCSLRITQISRYQFSWPGRFSSLRSFRLFSKAF